MPEIIENIEIIEKDKIRRHFDVTIQKWYFSITDVIAIVTDSADARNYWKVLKNRLKKAQKELVTKCNQLKMKSKDGKFYLTDVADAETMIEIIESVPGADIDHFRGWFEPFITSITSPSIPPRVTLGETENLGELKGEPAESELMVDMYQTDTSIVVEAMIAGVSLESLVIFLAHNKITIRGKREAPKNIFGEESLENNSKKYFLEELYWLSFSRTIILPLPVRIDEIEKKEEYGRLTITLLKI